jgi:hypothetical protein
MNNIVVNIIRQLILSHILLFKAYESYLLLHIHVNTFEQNQNQNQYLIDLLSKKMGNC